MDNPDLDAGRPYATSMRRFEAQLAVIEEKIVLLPDLHFLHSSQVAQQVMAVLRKAEAKPPEPHVGLSRQEMLLRRPT
jgi:hypothetical protein